MRSITLIILHGFIAQVAAKDLANKGISDEDLKALKDIESLNLLRESNAGLRDENGKLADER